VVVAHRAGELRLRLADPYLKQYQSLLLNEKFREQAFFIFKPNQPTPIKKEVTV
jgi:hypothetical protein